MCVGHPFNPRVSGGECGSGCKPVDGSVASVVREKSGQVFVA